MQGKLLSAYSMASMGGWYLYLQTQQSVLQQRTNAKEVLHDVERKFTTLQHNSRDPGFLRYKQLSERQSLQFQTGLKIQLLAELGGQCLACRHNGAASSYETLLNTLRCFGTCEPTPGAFMTVGQVQINDYPRRITEASGLRSDGRQNQAGDLDLIQPSVPNTWFFTQEKFSLFHTYLPYLRIPQSNTQIIAVFLTLGLSGQNAVIKPSRNKQRKLVVQVMTSMGDLFDAAAPSTFHEALKPIIERFLPEGWRNWRVSSCPTIPSDHLDRHRLRFCLPMLEVVRVYDPQLTTVSERAFRKLKADLFQWNLTRALIVRPSAVAKALRTEADYKQFCASTSPLMGSALSRGKINEAMAQSNGNDPPDDARSPYSPDGSDRPSYSSFSPPRPSTEALIAQHIRPLEQRLDGFQASVTAVDAKLDALQRSLDMLVKQPPLSAPESLSGRSSPSESSLSVHSTTQADDVQPHMSWGTEDLLNIHASSSQPVRPVPSFDPFTTEIAPAILDAPENVVQQLIQCQRLGTQAWNRIRYKEAELRLKRAGVFQPLQTNVALAQFARPDQALRQQERLLATMSYGLLEQRNCFLEAAKGVCASNPSIVPEFIQRFTGTDSPFKIISDDLIQFDPRLPAGRRLHGHAGPIQRILPSDHRPATPKVSDVLLQRNLLFLESPPLRSRLSPPGVRAANKLGGQLASPTGPANNCLSGRLLTCPPVGTDPPSSYRPSNFDFEVPWLERQHSQVQHCPLPTERLPRSHLEHEKTYDVPTTTESGGPPTTPSAYSSQIHMVFQRMHLPSGKTKFCSVRSSSWETLPPTTPTRTEPPQAAASNSAHSYPSSHQAEHDLVATTPPPGRRFPPPNQAELPGDGRIRLGHGVPPQQQTSQLCLEAKSTRLAYQHEGTAGSALGPPVECPNNSQLLDCTHVRQQDGGSAHSETRRPPLSCTPQRNDSTTEVLPWTACYADPPLLTRQIQYSGGQPVPRAVPPRMVAVAHDQEDAISQVGYSGGGPVCIQSLESSAPLRNHRLDGYTSGNSGRFFYPMALPASVGVPTATAYPTSPPPPQRSVRAVHPDSSQMGTDFLASGHQSQGSGRPDHDPGPTSQHLRPLETSTSSQCPHAPLLSLENSGWAPLVKGWSETERSLLMAAWRPSTLSTYRAPWNRWVAWATAQNTHPFHPTGENLARFLAHMHVTYHLSPASVALYRSAVTTWATPSAGPSLSSHPIVTRMLKGIAASVPPAPTRRIWDVDILNRWISEHPPNTESFFQVARHLALLLLLASSRRIHDLTLLRIDEDHLQTIGPDTVLWPSFGSKTDGPTRIQSGWLLKADPTRPIWNIPAWIDTYLTLRSKRCGSKQVPALFISSRGKVKPASRGTIAGWVSTALLAAGISATPGSTRSAVSSALARTHTSLDDIMARANWRSSTTFLRHYYRPLDNSNASPVSPAAFTPTV
ncbi:unnamed protein product [Nesidiocoris tenuis]|uniref:Tyr recombinase domain-containing protein n=1 Tax=Nesidiocoris tenuis TaxID=355587 RepID=A0A6H5H0M2_9HEMI|nr:unnamed protein product [Nesidiocoris tenuis]